ncbi:MAG: hypothetical protein KDE28_13185, partial [Anaerolineales bacterium]|nr:hypothetical protein [Anaerolineales bacterium]
SDGSAMLLATELWLTPAGRVIWHKGVEPDLMVDLPAGTVLLSPEREAQLSAAELQANPDEQLLQAITLLENTQ